MVEIENQLLKEQRRISKRKRGIIERGIILVILFVIFVFSFFVIQFYPLFEFPGLLVLFAVTLSFFSMLFVLWQANKYRVSSEQSLFLQVFELIENIENYIDTENETDRKKAESNAQEILSDMEFVFDVGTLKICKSEIEPSIEKFEDAFYRKIIGTVQQREKSDWIKAFTTLTEFAKFLLKAEPKISELNSIIDSFYSQISVTLPAKGQRKLGFQTITKNPFLKHVVVIVAFLILGAFAGYSGYYYVHVPIEYAYTMTITVPLTLTGIYAQYNRKR